MASRSALRSAPRPDPSTLALALAAVLGTLTAPARADSGGLPAGLDALATAADAVAPGVQLLYLDVFMDGRLVRPLVRFRRAAGRLSVEPAELAEIGLQLPDGMVADADGLIALDSIPGLQAQYDQPMQRITLYPATHVRRTQRLGYRRPGAVAVHRDQGFVLDWDAYARSQRGDHRLSLGTGAGWFGRFGSLRLNGVSRTGDGGADAYARLDTTWSYSDPQRLWTWSAGDIVSGGLGWTRPVRLGGVQWRRDFGVRPDLVTYPVPQFSADATVPSSVELYVNNVRQHSARIEPGPFVLSDFPRVVGAGEAIVVVTDALGRSTQTSVSLYVDYQRLARGLSDFSLEAGVLRRGFGVDSGDYASHPVASASWRRGISDDFTVELHGEASHHLRLGGVGLAWSPLGRYGVLTASLAHSSRGADGGEFLASESGLQHGAGYQWYGPRAGLDLYAQRASVHYRDLGALGGGSPPLRAQDRASLWLGIPRGSLSLTWLRYRDLADLPSRTLSLGLSQGFERFSLAASAFHDDRAGNGLSLTLNLPLGPGHGGSLGAEHRRGTTDLTARVRRDAPYAGGWGWEAQARDNGDGQLATRWRGGTAELSFGVDRAADHTGGFAQGNGSVVWMDGEAFASRRIGDAFAVVSTNGVPDVPILYENRVAGRSNARGYLLLAQLRGWQRNRIAIDPDTLPANLAVPPIEQLVTPADRSGVRVRFELEPIRSATVVLHDAAGAPVAAGTRVRRADGSEAIVGFDGELWLERYLDDEPVAWRQARFNCTATLPAIAHARSQPLRPTCHEELP